MTSPRAIVTEADLPRLPPLVQRYLGTSGVVGQPMVANVRVRLHGRIRSAVGSKWMPLRAEQYNFVENRERFFYLTSSMFGVPVQGYHRYADAGASMHVKAAGLITVAHMTGPSGTGGWEARHAMPLVDAGHVISAVRPDASHRYGRRPVAYA